MISLSFDYFWLTNLKLYKTSIFRTKPRNELWLKWNTLKRCPIFFMDPIIPFHNFHISKRGIDFYNVDNPFHPPNLSAFWYCQFEHANDHVHYPSCNFFDYNRSKKIYNEVHKVHIYIERERESKLSHRFLYLSLWCYRLYQASMTG